MNHIPKYEIPVRISLVQEEAVLGVVFIRQEERIIDMLCDQKQFFPVSTKAGLFLINKLSVVKLEVLEPEYIQEHQDNFPQTVLKQGSERHAELARRRSGNLEPFMPGGGAGSA